MRSTKKQNRNATTNQAATCSAASNTATDERHGVLQTTSAEPVYWYPVVSG